MNQIRRGDKVTRSPVSVLIEPVPLLQGETDGVRGLIAMSDEVVRRAEGQVVNQR
jgi:hypothetical protein